MPLREITANQDHDEEGTVPFSLASLLILQGKYNDEGKESITRRERPSLNLHFQHFARRQITTSLRRSSDINDIFDLRRCRRRCRRHSFLFDPFVRPRRLPQHADDNGYLHTQAFRTLNERRILL